MIIAIVREVSEKKWGNSLLIEREYPILNTE